MKTTHTLLTAVVVTAILTVAVAQAKVIRNAIWCDGQLFGVTVTPKDVPNKGPFDVLYNFAGGQRSISDSKPGDTDYNGGRWEVTPVAFTPAGLLVFDQDNDGKVDSELISDVDVAQAEAASLLTVGAPVRYFVCPLHP